MISTGFSPSTIRHAAACMALIWAAGNVRAENWVSSTGTGPIRTTTTATKVGIGITGTSNVVNTLDVEGGAAIGASYSGSSAAPSNGLIVQGKVGIGMVPTSSTTEQLTVQGNVKVNGTLQADQGIKVKTWSMEVPDYVFGKNYSPMPVAQLEAYLNAHHHLPEVPSAMEINEKGMDLAEMNLRLLKKVEELTLYMIGQNKRIDSLSNLKAR